MTAEFHDDKMMFPQASAWRVAAFYWATRESIPKMMAGDAKPLYDQAALDAAVNQANARQTAAWRLMTEKLVAAERERCAKLCDDLAVLESGDHFDGITADELARRIRGPNV